MMVLVLVVVGLLTPVEGVMERAAASPTAPVKGKITAAKASSSGKTIITINRGRAAGVVRGWTGTLVDSNGDPVTDGAFVVKKYTQMFSIATVELALGVVGANPTVLLWPPPTP